MAWWYICCVKSLHVKITKLCRKKIKQTRWPQTGILTYKITETLSSILQSYQNWVYAGSWKSEIIPLLLTAWVWPLMVTKVLRSITVESFNCRPWYTRTMSEKLFCAEGKEHVWWAGSYKGWVRRSVLSFWGRKQLPNWVWGIILITKNSSRPSAWARYIYRITHGGFFITWYWRHSSFFVGTSMTTSLTTVVSWGEPKGKRDPILKSIMEKLPKAK